MKEDMMATQLQGDIKTEEFTLLSVIGGLPEEFRAISTQLYMTADLNLDKVKSTLKEYTDAQKYLTEDKAQSMNLSALIDQYLKSATTVQTLTRITTL